MQGVLVFASSAARAAAVTSPQEGQYSYLKDTNSTEYYDGAAWIAAPIGDITGVTAGVGISGGGTSGDVTVTNSMATAITTSGDLIYGTGSGTFTRRGIGSTGNVLTVSGGVPVWSAPAGGGKVLQVVTGTSTTSTVIATTTPTDTTLTATITPTLNTSKILVLISQPVNSERNTKKSYVGWTLLRGATAINGSGSTAVFGSYAEAVTTSAFRMIGAMSYLDSPATTSATTYKTQGRVDDTANGATSTWNTEGTSSIVLLEIGA
jgi:hypothetical protein